MMSKDATMFCELVPAQTLIEYQCNALLFFRYSGIEDCSYCCGNNNSSLKLFVIAIHCGISNNMMEDKNESSSQWMEDNNEAWTKRGFGKGFGAKTRIGKFANLVIQLANLPFLYF
jgi:hypothetical protein